jgi:1-pyrroline-5-carboxylate dehydrogenase
MLKGFFHVPKAVNEPVKGYAPNSPEKQPFKQLTLKCGILKSTPLYIGSEEIRTGNTKNDHTTTNIS